MKAPPLSVTYRFTAAMCGAAPIAAAIGFVPPGARSSVAARGTADHRQKFNDSASTCAPLYLRLEHVTRPYLTTAETAHYLNLKPQTLRAWACYELGPLRPVRIARRLGWRTDEVRELLSVSPPNVVGTLRG